MNNLDKNNIEQLLSIVNQHLREGSSISTIERELSFGKDTLRRKLNRAGYKFSKEKKQFVFDEYLFKKHHSNQNIEKIKDNQTVTQIIQAEVEPKCNLNATQNNKYLESKEIEGKEEKLTMQMLTESQLKTLIKMIEEYQAKENLVKYKKDKDNIISRSFRSYRNVLDDFATFCKEKELIQREAVANAFILFMKLNR